MDSLLEGYPAPNGPWDEMMAADGVRWQYRTLADVFARLGAAEIESRVAYLSSRYLDTGVTFDFAGQEEPFPVDIVPRLLGAAEFSHIEAGLKQRVRVLEAFLADVYGQGKVFTEGVVPRALITGSDQFVRAVSGIHPANGVRIQIAGIDLIRDADGQLRVLEDNVRIPSGVSYVLTNRQVTAAALPEVMRGYSVARVEDYPARLRAALVASAPGGVTDPNIVVMTPGVFNSAYFEHALLARTMGVPLVEGRDLVVRQGHVYLRTTNGLAPVHVIYRRVDDEFIDPFQFKPDSVLGTTGLVSAVANGTVTIANALGNGVADDKLVYTYVPDLTRYYLGEDPILPNVDTWRLEEADAREEVFDRMDELVIKPVAGSGGKGIVMGPQCSKSELNAAREAISADPRGWIAQPLVQLSTVPTMTDEGMRPRHVDLRPFIINSGDDQWVLPGGLTRVALKKGEFIVNSSQGGGSKDTWVLTTSADKGEGPLHHVTDDSEAADHKLPDTSVLDSPPDDESQQQQQQQQHQNQAGGSA